MSQSTSSTVALLTPCSAARRARIAAPISPRSRRRRSNRRVLADAGDGVAEGVRGAQARIERRFGERAEGHGARDCRMGGQSGETEAGRPRPRLTPHAGRGSQAAERRDRLFAEHTQEVSGVELSARPALTCFARQHERQDIAERSPCHGVINECGGTDAPRRARLSFIIHRFHTSMTLEAPYLMTHSTMRR